METITFYSYKGGVGRTLALANIALYLSRFGQDVCIMDFDLEAPGLHYKFPDLLTAEDINKGIVDCLYEFMQNKTLPKRLKDYSVKIVSKSTTQGEVRIIPAGRISSNYWKKLASIDWRDLFYREVSEGIPCFIDLKSKIQNEFKCDFLLIDSRTGITEMSGVCTSLLPDKVVFMIVNNNENIEGARHILRSINKIERLPGQKRIEIIFALTRIPMPRKDKNGKLEREIINDISNFLNEPTDDLESQVSIDDICILHSDRELEIKESLRIGEKGTSYKTPLLRDYLRLFSKIIPEDVIIPKLGDIINEITSSPNLLLNPDKAQEELEGFVSNYMHQVSLEKLIDFYVLRNESSEKMIETFHQLFETYEVENFQTLSKYASLFMQGEIYTWSRPHFKLDIIEKFIKQEPPNKIDIELKLARAYKTYENEGKALEHYFNVLDEIPEKNEVLGDILEINLSSREYKKALKLCERYTNLINSDISLKIKKINILYKSDRYNDLKKIFVEDGLVESSLIAKRPALYFHIKQKLEGAVAAEEKMTTLLDEFLANPEPNEEALYEFGQIFHKKGKFDLFKKKLSGYRYGRRVIHELERRFEY